MRVLVVGAGIAGLALAALLARQGRQVLLVERQPEGADAGYVIGLWPQGTRVLHALDGAHAAFGRQSAPMLRYRLLGGAGRHIGTWDARELTARFDPVGCIERARLIELLQRSARGVELRRGVSVDRLSPAADGVEVELSDGARQRFDAVIGADGLHSRVRELLFGRLAERDTGWGCFAWWGEAALAAPGETTEHWNAGRVALVGDAAAAFLPTAGIGASMALESAAALADEVSRSDAAHVAHALALYARRRRHRVLAAQQQSRWLARLVFVRSRALCALRERALERVSLRRMIGPIYEQLETPI
jgi:2-polyprenyl-6-methoxyphenol hydroxylase-like FAD-dependent oxidoreductase